jgi:hypothetical protein
MGAVCILQGYRSTQTRWREAPGAQKVLEGMSLIIMRD